MKAHVWVMPKRTVLDPQVVRELIGRRVDPLAGLTPREREVLELMAEGRTNAGIAEMPNPFPPRYSRSRQGRRADRASA